MRILVQYAPPFRRWHRVLGERIDGLGHAVGFSAVRPASRRPEAFGLAALECRLYRFAPAWNAAVPPPLAGIENPDLTLVIAGAVPDRGRVLMPRFDGRAGEAAMQAALRTGSAPIVTVDGGMPGAMRPLVCGRVAVEDTYVSARALDFLLPRLVTLLVQGVARLDAPEPLPPIADADAAPREISAAAYFVCGVWHKARRRFGAARGRPDHWRLALRRPGGATATLPLDDKGRLGADPFLFADGARLCLFYEEFAYAGGKGVIACRDVDPIAPASNDVSASRVVLEEPFHLSYPLVLRHDDAIYMLPETSSAGCLRLYRAAPFPDRWVPATILVADCTLSDATPVFHQGRWWLFATSHDDGGTSWDQLCLFHAPDLLGPWTPHAGNPVLIDAAAARPAGHMWHEDGVLMRPVQDCRRGYGEAVAICRVDRLDEGGFAQSVVGRIDPPADVAATGVHTFNREAGWEAIDYKVAHPRT